MMSTAYPPGTAPIKLHSVLRFYFSLSRHSTNAPQDAPFHYRTGPPPDDDAAEGSTNHVSLGQLTETNDDAQNAQTQGEEPCMSGAQCKKLAREERKKRRGQNKGRRLQKVRDELDLCWKVATGEACEFGLLYV